MVNTATVELYAPPKPNPLARMCLRYVNWRDRIRRMDWLEMQAETRAMMDGVSAEGITIRSLAEFGTVPGLLKLHNRAYRGARDFQRAGWVQAMALNAAKGFDPSLVWIAYRGDEPVAFCMARVAGGNGRITGIGVRPELRRQGIGTGLLAHALASLARRGAFTVDLETVADDVRARSFFQRFGFATSR